MRVVQHEVGRIHQNGAVGRLRCYCESPEDRRGERLADGQRLIGLAAGTAKLFVHLNEKHFGSDALEPNDPACRYLTSIETKIVRADAERQGCHVDVFGALAVWRQT